MLGPENSTAGNVMITLQARIMLIAFVTLAAAIIYNATFLQKGPHPAPITVEAGSTENRIVKTNREPRKIAKTLPKHTEIKDSQSQSKTIASIQRKLYENDYEPGPVDGVQGYMTRAAIMAYQDDNELGVTGVASKKLLKNMILGVSLGDASEDNSSPIPDETKKLVKAVQLTLKKLGFDPGLPDGLWGGSTRKAIENFEREHKLSIKGRISGQFLKELMQANGGRLSKVSTS
jgi:peptidoglycan hydrolase-like protein with peptidoglycan-binding domain